MAWNGSGQYIRTNGTYNGTTVWTQDKNAAVKIVAARHDTHDQDLADGINNCLAIDGQNAMTNDLNIGSNDILGADTIQVVTLINPSGAAGITINDALTVSGASDFSDNMDVSGSFTATGGASISNGATVYGGLTSDSDFDCFGDAAITGTTDITGAVSMGAGAAVTGNVSIDGDLSVTGNALTALNAAVGIFSLACTNNATIDGTLYIDTIEAQGALLTIDDALTVTGDMTVTGDFKTSSNAPATPSSTGTAGTITWDTSAVHVCTATDTWKSLPFDPPVYTKQTISGTGTQSFDLDNGWLADNTISGTQDLEFSNGVQGANGVIKLINTNGNTFDLSGSGLTFKRSNNGVLEAYSQITLEAGASTEQIITYHFQSATEVIYTVS